MIGNKCCILGLSERGSAIRVDYDLMCFGSDNLSTVKQTRNEFRTELRLLINDKVENMPFSIVRPFGTEHKRASLYSVLIIIILYPAVSSYSPDRHRQQQFNLITLLP